jgi:hypothetical protein
MPRRLGIPISVKARRSVTVFAMVVEQCGVRGGEERRRVQDSTSVSIHVLKTVYTMIIDTTSIGNFCRCIPIL